LQKLATLAAMSLSGKTIVFTGTFTMTRIDATRAADSAGAKVDSFVTKNTSILVAGTGTGADEDDAKANGIEIWTEDQFMAAIGAFLGWKATLFSLMFSSVLGAVVGVGLIAVGRQHWSGRLPYGPYIAAAATAWLFGASAWWDRIFGR
jgi:leader peptidase (prepilin peptidase)/N-methyltransferase